MLFFSLVLEIFVVCSFWMFFFKVDVSIMDDSSLASQQQKRNSYSAEDEKPRKGKTIK